MARTAFDVIVIGGGHAGAEAAWAAARLGARTALVTFSRGAIGRLSCNPAVGGIGKGQMVREIDALGGLMGRVADEAGIQFRMLNRRKGPAVWAPRAQTDSLTYPAILQRYLENCPNLEIIEAGVDQILAESEQGADCARGSGSTASGKAQAAGLGCAPLRVTGIALDDGRQLVARAVIVTLGTFLRGLMHTGECQTVGGRVGEQAAVGLSASLKRLGLELGRLKTGTPPRVARDTVDFAQLDEQPGDDPPVPFSFLTERLSQAQVPCWISWTNAAIHERIRANLHRAPMYSGQIQSHGPRYCPSIEDKVVRFAEKDRHQIFLEPESRDGERIYLNGISTSLPRDVQAEMVALVPGLERARIVQWGYAVEYDFVPPEQIDARLMTKRVAGLFLAGQVNGTSGYEEAAGQGLLAGVNAVRFVAGGEPVILGRDQAYIGVMIDDLVTRGVLEPYRMFTSRAEHRLHLRYDNADERLTPVGRGIGLVDDERWERFRAREERLEALRAMLGTLRLGGKSAREWLKRPDEDGSMLFERLPDLRQFAQIPDLWARAVVDIKYEGYLARQRRTIEQFRELEDRIIPPGLDFSSIRHLRREAAERWTQVRPRNVGQAARASGIHPADIPVLLVHLAAAHRAAAENI